MRISEIANPRQTVLITTGHDHEKPSGRIEQKDNIITIDWHTPLSFEPMLYGIVIGKNRFSLELIRKSGVFVVNFMPYSKEKEVLYCGRNSGQFKDKFKETGLTKGECRTIDCSRIKESTAYLECEIINEIETGDHIMFIGKVVNFKKNNDTKRLFHTHGDDFTTTLK